MSTGTSVVICTYTLDRWADLQQAVGSVLNQQQGVVEVIVVVDHNAQLLSRAREYWPCVTPGARRDRARVRVVANNCPPGLSGARNTGVAVACSEIVAFLDDDAVADVRWAERLLVPYLDPEVVACGGSVVPRLLRSRPRWWPAEFDWVVGCSYPGMPSTSGDVRNLIGANMSARRAAVLDVGGFRDGMGRVGSCPEGCEETELFIRIVQRWPGHRVVYEPAALVHHTVRSDRLSWGYFRSRCYAEGVSKAKLAKRVGGEHALASERSYAATVLPRGIAIALLRACRGDVGAALRALSIGAGLATTTFGYLRGRLSSSSSPFRGRSGRLTYVAIGSSGRAERTRADPLATTAISLMANTVITSGLGVVFWGLASRLYSANQLGEDAALISAMMLLSIISQLNLGMGIPRLLPQVRARRWRPVLAAYVLTAVVALVLTVCFVTFAPRLSAGFAFVDGHVTVVLVAAVVLWNVFALQDAAFTAARWAPILPVENGLFGVLKIVLMVWLAHHVFNHGIFVGWVAGMAIVLVPTNGLLFTRALKTSSSQAEGDSTTVLPLTDRGRIARYLVTDYVATLLSHGYNALLPLLVIAVLGRATNAYFYVAFLIAGTVGTLAQSLSTSLVVEGAHDESKLAALARRSVLRYVKLVAPAVGVLIAAAPWLLRLFGPAYADHGSTVLRLLLAGTIPQAIITLYLGVKRVRAEVHHVLAVEGATVVLVTAGAILGMPSFGLSGVGLAWLLGQSAVALMIVPDLRSVTRGSDRSPAALGESLRAGAAS